MVILLKCIQCLSYINSLLDKLFALLGKKERRKKKKEKKKRRLLYKYTSNFFIEVVGNMHNAFSPVAEKLYFIPSTESITIIQKWTFRERVRSLQGVQSLLLHCEEDATSELL